MFAYANICKPKIVSINVMDYKYFLDKDDWGYEKKKKKITPRMVLITKI